MQIGVRTGKLWSLEVGIADSQGWCGNSGIPPFSILPRFGQFRDAMLSLDGPGNSYTQSMTVPQLNKRLHNEIIHPEEGRNR